MNGINVRTAVGRKLFVCCALASLVCGGESVGEVVDSEESSAICDDNGRLQSDEAGLVSQFIFRVDVWLPEEHGQAQWLEEIDAPEAEEHDQVRWSKEIDVPVAEEHDQRLEFLVQMDQPFRVLHSQEDAEFVVEGVLTDAEDGNVLLQYSIASQRGLTKGRVWTQIELAPGIERSLGAAGPRFTGVLLPPELVSAPSDTP